MSGQVARELQTEAVHEICRAWLMGHGRVRPPSMRSSYPVTPSGPAPRARGFSCVVRSASPAGICFHLQPLGDVSPEGYGSCSDPSASYRKGSAHLPDGECGDVHSFGLRACSFGRVAPVPHTGGVVRSPVWWMSRGTHVESDRPHC